MIKTEVVSSGSRVDLGKGWWGHGPSEEVAEVLSIACRAVQSYCPKQGVAIIIRREP